MKLTVCFRISIVHVFRTKGESVCVPRSYVWAPNVRQLDCAETNVDLR